MDMHTASETPFLEYQFKPVQVSQSVLFVVNHMFFNFKMGKKIVCLDKTQHPL